MADSLVFLHHSCGNNWLKGGLNDALLAKDYIAQRNDITYGTEIAPDAGRPDSLGPVPGDNTDMNHWLPWFNDYLEAVKAHGCTEGVNKIIMFKSCYPLSNIGPDAEVTDPFDEERTIANYSAIYRHPDGSGKTYSRNGQTYKPLEDIFAENPDTLFIPVSAPARHYMSAEDPQADGTTDDQAARARKFNNWLKNDWQASYNAAHPGLNNVAVFDWFDVLANPADAADHANRMKKEFGGESGNSHPNDAANSATVEVFATGADNFIDRAWKAFVGAAVS